MCTSSWGRGHEHTWPCGSSGGQGGVGGRGGAPRALAVEGGGQEDRHGEGEAAPRGLSSTAGPRAHTLPMKAAGKVGGVTSSQGPGAGQVATG